MLQEEFVSLREGRFVIPVKSEHKRHLTGIIHGVSQTGATVFLEPSEIIELNNELSLLLNEEKREIMSTNCEKIAVFDAALKIYEKLTQTFEDK